MCDIFMLFFPRKRRITTRDLREGGGDVLVHRLSPSPHPPHKKKSFFRSNRELLSHVFQEGKKYQAFLTNKLYYRP